MSRNEKNVGMRGATPRVMYATTQLGARPNAPAACNSTRIIAPFVELKWESQNIPRKYQPLKIPRHSSNFDLNIKSPGLLSLPLSCYR